MPLCSQGVVENKVGDQSRYRILCACPPSKDRSEGCCRTVVVDFEPGIAVRLGLGGPFAPWTKVPSVSTVDGCFLSEPQWVDFVISRNYGSRQKTQCLSSYPHLLNAVVTSLGCPVRVEMTLGVPKCLKQHIILHGNVPFQGRRFKRCTPCTSTRC